MFVVKNSFRRVANSQTLLEISDAHIRVSKTAIERSRELLASAKVYPALPALNRVAGFKPLPNRNAAHMSAPTVAELRAQASHARRLADEMFNREAQAELHRIAVALDAQADGVEARRPNAANRSSE